MKSKKWHRRCVAHEMLTVTLLPFDSGSGKLMTSGEPSTCTMPLIMQYGMNDCHWHSIGRPLSGHTGT